MRRLRRVIQISIVLIVIVVVSSIIIIYTLPSEPKMINIIANPAAYDGKTVTLTGRVMINRQFGLEKDYALVDQDQNVISLTWEIQNMNITQFLNKSVRITGTIIYQPDIADVSFRTQLKILKIESA